MKLKYHSKFTKHYKKRIQSSPNLQLRFKNRIELLLHEPNNPLLRDHSVSGKKQGLRAFSITGDLRVVYKIENKETICLYDIGSHNQVYK